MDFLVRPSLPPMITRITLRNFMSHAHTVIEPAPGLTVLVGPNNCGKSAVVSALETLCNNSRGDYMVRHDEREVNVTIETEDGHTFVWERKGGKVSYTVDGVKTHRVMPDDLHNLLRLPKVEAGENGDPFDIHFGSQKSPIFLLNEPESRAALFFASSSDAEVLLKMQKRHRSKVTDQKNAERRLNTEIAKLDLRLNVLEPLPSLVGALEKADGQFEKVRELESRILAIREEIGTLDRHTLLHDQSSRRYGCLVPLAPLPEMANAVSLELHILALLDAEHEKHSDENCWVILTPLASPPVLEDTVALSTGIRTLVTEGETLSRWSGCSIVLNKLCMLPAFDDVDKLLEISRALSQSQRNQCNLLGQTKCLNQLKDPPTILLDVGTLEKIVGALTSTGLVHGKCVRQQGILVQMSPPPILADVKPLAGLIGSLETALSTAAEFEKLRQETVVTMQETEAEIRAAEQLVGNSAQIIPGSKRGSPFVPMAISGAVSAMVIALIFLFGPGWVGTGDSNSDKALNTNETNPNAIAKSDEKPTRGNVPKSQDPAGVDGPKKESDEKTEPKKAEIQDPKKVELAKKEEPKKEEPKKVELAKKEEPKKEEPKKVEPTKREEPKKEEPKKVELTKKEEPKKEEPKKVELTKKEEPKKEEAKKVDVVKLEEPKKVEQTEAKKVRLRQIRKLLDDAELANAGGKHWDAALAYGQAAILYPDELAAVENPERVRAKFINALSRYQGEVERALLKASQPKAGEK
jgi:exonuclease SbcC